MSISRDTGASDNRPVVVYDGECRLCRAGVDRVRRRDHAGVFEFVPRQQPGLEQRFPKLASEDFNTGMRLIEPDGSILAGADVVYALTRRVGPLRWLAWLYRVPGLHWLWKVMYAWIARNRHRLAGRCEDGACTRPDVGN